MTPRFLLPAALCVAVLASGCDSGGPSSGAFGTVTNSRDFAVEGATVVMSGADDCSATTDADGEFECDVPAGSYTVAVSATGYAPQTFTATVADGGTEVTVPDLVGLGSVNATLIDASDGDEIANAPLECRRQLASGAFGGVEFTTTSSAAAQVVIDDVFTGEAQCAATVGSETIPVRFTIIPNTTGTIAVTRPPAAGTFRVVLTWGELPDDLDSHLTGPIAGGSDRFHVYYGSDSYEGHNLDLDDTSSFGPETITIVPAGVNGTYRYSVHNYDDQSSSGAQGIFTSGTTVRLFDSTGLIRTFVAPAPSGANGGTNANTWRVFEMSLSGSSVTINPSSGTQGLSYQLASSPSDITVFLTGGPAPGPAPAKVAI